MLMSSGLLSRSAFLSVLLLSSSSVALADQSAILSQVQAVLPQYEIEHSEFHQASGIYVVNLKGGPTLHVTQNGQFFVAGDLYRIDGTNLINETEKAKLAKIESLSESQMIIYRANNPQAHITVFTDVDCSYCQLLHQEVPALNEAGVTVRYLAYPRAGVGSMVYNKMVSVWCSDDPQEWLTKVKLGVDIPQNRCVNPVASHYDLGNEVGVRGTPSIVFDDGTFLPGYLPASELIKRLGL